MTPIDVLRMMVFDYTLRTVWVGSGMVGALAGVLGCFAYLRKQGMMGAIIAHSSLSGITTAFLLGSFAGGAALAEKLVLPGALIGGVASMVFVSMVIHYTTIKSDTAMGIAIALFFGGGVFLLRVIQSMALPGHRILRDYLFGQAATMTRQDVVTILVFLILGALILLLFWKEFKLHTFDPSFAAAIGYPMHRLDQLLLATIVIAIVVGLRTVGVILMISLLVAPAAAARQWTRNLEQMAVLAGVFGCFSGVLGAVLSAVIPGLPTGPVISLTATTMVMLSLVAAPRRGTVSRWLVRRRRRRLTAPLGTQK